MTRKINSLLLVLAITTLFIACDNNTQEEKTDTTIPTVDQTAGETVTLTPLSSGYFLKNDVTLGTGVSYMVATQETSLTNNFGYGAVMGEDHQHPNFEQSFVLAIAVNMKGKTVVPSFSAAKLVDGNLRVSCNIKVTAESATYESTPIALASVQRDERIQSVSFYEGNKLSRTIELAQ